MTWGREGDERERKSKVGRRSPMQLTFNISYCGNERHREYVCRSMQD